MRTQRAIPVTLCAALLCWGCDGSEKQRPDVQFDHAKHEEALEGKCEPCHQEGELGFVPSFKGAAQLKDKETLAQLFHDACMGCHEEDADAGKEAHSRPPRTCAGCHNKARRVSAHVAIRFDQSLHARHVEATGGKDKCDTCHNKGEPEGAIKGDKDKIHASCVGCHLNNSEAKRQTGPVTCAGCHDAAEQRKIAKLDKPARLKAEQKDQLWIRTKGAKAKPVAFDHKAHEAVTFCTSCHHETKRPCGDCHTPGKGTKDGGFVTLEDAQHHPTSKHSCVGCHQKKVKADKGCVGCHEQLPMARAGKKCETCHTGTTKDAPMPAAAVAAALPPTSDDFPETVKIGYLENKYAPSNFPHRKVVAALFNKANGSALGRRFHGGAATLCAGCHHESKGMGQRPPSCKSCHGKTANLNRDQPGLTVAYHRQCLGCHKDMGLKQTGCTDCHQKKPKKETSK